MPRKKGSGKDRCIGREADHDKWCDRCLAGNLKSRCYRAAEWICAVADSVPSPGMTSRIKGRTAADENHPEYRAPRPVFRPQEQLRNQTGRKERRAQQQAKQQQPLPTPAPKEQNKKDPDATPAARAAKRRTGTSSGSPSRWQIKPGSESGNQSTVSAWSRSGLLPLPLTLTRLLFLPFVVQLIRSPQKQQDQREQSKGGGLVGKGLQKHRQHSDLLALVEEKQVENAAELAQIERTEAQQPQQRTAAQQAGKKAARTERAQTALTELRKQKQPLPALPPATASQTRKSNRHAKSVEEHVAELAGGCKETMQRTYATLGQRAVGRAFGSKAPTCCDKNDAQQLQKDIEAIKQFSVDQGRTSGGAGYQVKVAIADVMGPGNKASRKRTWGLGAVLQRAALKQRGKRTRRAQAKMQTQAFLNPAEAEAALRKASAREYTHKEQAVYSNKCNLSVVHKYCREHTRSVPGKFRYRLIKQAKDKSLWVKLDGSGRLYPVLPAMRVVRDRGKAKRMYVKHGLQHRMEDIAEFHAEFEKSVELQGQGARAALLPMRRTGLVGNARKSDGPRDLSRLQSSARPSCAFSEADPRPDKVDRQQDSSTGRAGRFCGTYLTLGAFWEKMSQLAPKAGIRSRYVPSGAHASPARWDGAWRGAVIDDVGAETTRVPAAGRAVRLLGFYVLFCRLKAAVAGGLP